jgi:hypothetical protein
MFLLLKPIKLYNFSILYGKRTFCTRGDLRQVLPTFLDFFSSFREKKMKPLLLGSGFYVSDQLFSSEKKSTRYNPKV